MQRAPAPRAKTPPWTPIRDPDGRYSTGIRDFDHLLDGGFPRGCLALYRMDDTVTRTDLDLLLFPSLLNLLYQSRGVLAVLPSRDSPREFRSRLTRYVTRRRFDSRVRIIDYVGEDEGPKYVVSLKFVGEDEAAHKRGARVRSADVAKMEAAERAVQGHRRRAFLELYSFEVLDTLVGPEQARRMFFVGIKRARSVGNLMIGLLGPGLASEAGVRRMADLEFELHRGDLGLTIRGVQPSFAPHLVTPDRSDAMPHVSFAPSPS
ncbi:MAG TPA: gas vesicle protein GvpD basic region 2 domain-containing protein [Thermoplasmata archaeon]|jgi:hypothetical protein|nr:gas vesicle protein GvpD basic region 2 domain-containing protein [Thermoplasmata archaeon]